MVDIVTRLGKGSPLTNAEVDANFTNLAEVSGVTGEPMGHEDRTTSTISFNASTRTFTIAPVASSFTVWCKGKKVVVSTAQTVTIPNTTGMYSIYYDANGVLSAKSGYFTFSLEAPTAYVYWNAATGTAPYFGDERHGVVLDWQTHEYLHRTRGAALASGFSASGYVLGGNGSSNSHAQITLEGGTFFDEDMKIIVTATNTPTAGTWEQDLLSPARIPVLYLSGTGWVIDAPTDYPLKQGTSRPQYNAYSGGVWSTADVANNKYATSWILATNNLTYPVIAIIGQAENDLQSAAEAVDFTALQLPGFPSVEFRPLYKLIFQCADSCTNAVHASLVSITDIRSIAAAGTAASIVTDHGNLSGLSDDDHPQYIHVDTLRTVSAAVKASFLPSQTSNAGKFLQTDGTATSWQALTSGNITTALGFTPYNATNPSGYISGITSGMVTTALGFTPYNATNPSGYVTAAGARGAISVTGAGSYDSATGVINIVGGVTSFNTRTGAITLSSADVTTALGFTPYNNTNPSGYITGITSTMVTTALGFTPYNSSNPNGYISSITSANVTTALGFTPYNATNPSGYITSSALSGYLTSASAASTYLPLSGGTLTGTLAISNGDNSYVTFGPNTTYSGSLRIGTGVGPLGLVSGRATIYSDNGNLKVDAGTGQTLYLNQHNGGGTVYIGGTTNYIIHTGNYNSFAPTLTGGNASGTWGINITGNAGSATSATGANQLNSDTSSKASALQYWQLYGNSTLNPNGDWHWAIRMSHGDADTYYSATLAIPFGSDSLYFRRKTNGTNQSWISVLNSANFGSYALPLSGGMMTGSIGHVRGAHNYFERSAGVAVGAMGWHSDDRFYVAGHPGYGPGAGNVVRVYGFGSDLAFGNATVGDSFYVNGTTGTVVFNTSESINLYGVRGRFTNEYIHLYNKVGVGNPSGWGQGETSTPDKGLSTYGGLRVAYGNNATSQFDGPITAPVGTFTNDGSSRVLYLKGSGNIIQFCDADGTFRWENVGRNGTYYIYKGYGTGAGYKFQANDDGSVTINNGSATSVSGALTVTGGSNSIIAQDNGGSGDWRGRIISRNSTYDRAAFLGVYNGNTGVFAHNHALSAWAPLYVNTSDASSFGGAVVLARLQMDADGTDSWYRAQSGNRHRFTTTGGADFIIGNGSGAATLNGNQVLHAGNYTSYSPSLGGSGASGTWGISISGNASSATRLINLRTINGIGFDGTANIDTTEWFHSDRDFPSGTLITTNINYAVTYGDPFVLEIRGNSYGNIVPLDLQYQGYIYNDTIINHGGLSNGLMIQGLVAINNGGNLCFWFPTQGYWNGYNVKVYAAYATRAVNRVTSITGGGKPTTAKEVALTANIRQSLNSGNYTSYSPSLTGSGASGTWSINVTGSANTANTASNSNTVGGLTPAQFFNNMGNNHTSYADFNSVPGFGAYYVQGPTNGPTGIAGNQFYGITLGLGNDYSYSSYASQLYWPRRAQNGSTYIYVRDREGGSWTSWTKVQAGYADSAGSVVATGVTNLYSPNGATVVSGDAATAMPSTGQSLIHTLATGPSGNDGHIIGMSWASTTTVYGAQIWLDTDPTNRMAIRSRSSTGVWNSFSEVLTAGNYTSYSPSLAGSGASGTWGINISGSSDRTYRGIIEDTRAGLRSPNAYDDYRAHFEFTNQIVGGDWHTAFTMQGWHDGYAAWQIIGPASTSAHENFYLRSGINTSWNSVRSILHSGNYSSYSPPYSGGTLSGTWYFNTSAGSTSGALASPALQAYSTGNNAAWFSWHKAGHYAVNMGLDSDNVLRIGGWSASANRWQLDMSGNMTVAGNVTAYSDERLKKDWAPVRSGFVEALASIKSGTYTRIDSEERQAGVSAQDWQKLLPETVSTDNEGTLSLAYGNAALVSAVELAKEVVDLRTRVAQLESLINKLIGD